MAPRPRSLPSAECGQLEREGTVKDKYNIYAPVYDVLSGEFAVYRAGRILGIDALDPRPGDQILDIGCGTGLNFPLLQDRIGPTGTIIGIDRSPGMLRQAHRRARLHRWDNIILVQADIISLDASAVMEQVSGQGGTPASDGIIATYSLSLMPAWRTAWANIQNLLGAEARVSIVDMQEPYGSARWLAPLARFACRIGGADIFAHPWQFVEEDCVGVDSRSARGGHLQIRAGTLQHRHE
ncbi:class I SAM-dependent methyltransferase [Arthrobacter sp. UYCu712]|uniref:class I SAM-dependent methyltransferase n=1 Tax=Arthrobacter sp. UYCu712 TaxID=3156340 RepID=UPI003398146F